jgi:hypothetical protein
MASLHFCLVLPRPFSPQWPISHPLLFSHCVKPTLTSSHAGDLGTPAHWWAMNKSILGVPGYGFFSDKTDLQETTVLSCSSGLLHVWISYLLSANGEAASWGGPSPERCPGTRHMVPSCRSASYYEILCLDRGASVFVTCSQVTNLTLWDWALAPLCSGSTSVSPPHLPHSGYLKGREVISPPWLCPALCPGHRPVAHPIAVSRICWNNGLFVKVQVNLLILLCNIFKVHVVLDFWTWKTFLSPWRLINSFYYRPEVFNSQFQNLNRSENQDFVCKLVAKLTWWQNLTCTEIRRKT